MRNKRGENNALLGGIIIAAVGILVAAIFIVASANNVQTFTTTNTIANQTGLTFPANGSTLSLNGQAIVAGSTPIIINQTGTVIAAGNYTIRNYFPASSGGYVTSLLANPNQVNYSGQSINVSYSYEPIGFATDAGSRSIGSLVLVFTAIIALAAALTPAIRSGAFELLGLR